jgi:hypothetical protein
MLISPFKVGTRGADARATLVAGLVTVSTFCILLTRVYGYIMHVECRYRYEEHLDPALDCSREWTTEDVCMHFHILNQEGSNANQGSTSA